MWNYLKEQNRPIVIYGMGNGADKIIDTLSQIGISVSGVLRLTILCVGKVFVDLRLKNIAN